MSLSRTSPHALESFQTMMLRETVMQIKFLACQGMTKSRIAERFGISRQTVYNHLNRSEPFPKPRKERPSKLDAFRDHIRARLEKFDLPATTLLRELRVLGYQGSLTILRDFMRPLKADFVRRVFRPAWTKVCGIRSAPVFLILAACRPGDSQPSDDLASYSQRDSAGVMISVNTVSGSMSATGWKVDPVPDLILGDASTPSGTLYRIQGVEGLTSGGTLVVDGGSRELRFFDGRGHILKRVGGQGAGPGEFEDPVLVPWTDQDSLLVFDKRLPRFQIFSSGGEYSGAFRHLNGWPAGRLPPVGALRMQALFEVRRLQEGEKSEARSRLKQASGEYFWYDMRNAELTNLMSFVVDWAYETSGGISDLPFSPAPTAAVGPGGAWITNGRDFEIRGFDSQGNIRHLIRVDEPKRPVTPRMVQSRIDVLMAQYPEVERGQLERAYSEVPLPDSLPAIQSLLVDDTGWLWAQRYHWDPSRPKEWIVFDRDGRAHGTVETPSGLEVKWIGEDRILGVWLDDMDVEYVRQHRLHRAVQDPPAGAGEREQGRAGPPGGSPVGATGDDE